MVPLKPEIRVTKIIQFLPHRKTLRLHYKGKSVNSVYRISMNFENDIKSNKYTMWINRTIS
jgi:hypothetical protein